MVSLRLSQKTVELPHLAHSRFSPAVRSDDRLDLFSQGLYIFRRRSEVEEGVGDALFISVPRLACTKDHTHIGGRMDGCEVD